MMAIMAIILTLSTIAFVIVKMLVYPAVIIFSIVFFAIYFLKGSKSGYKLNFMIKDLYVDGPAEKKQKPKKKAEPPYKLSSMIKDLRFDEYIHMKEQSKKRKRLKKTDKENTHGNQT